jgi:hypothetical protein
LQQFRKLTNTTAPPTDATDEERADLDDALADKVEAAIQPHLDRWLMLRGRPIKGETPSLRTTSRFVPFNYAGDPGNPGKSLGPTIAQDNPQRLWALLSGARHDSVKTIFREEELAAEWEGVPDVPMGPKAHLVPCLAPKAPKRSAAEVARSGARPRLQTPQDGASVPIPRALLVQMGVNTYIGAGAIGATATGSLAKDLYTGALLTGRTLLKFAGVDVSGLDNDE